MNRYIKDVRRNAATRDWDAYVIADGAEVYLGSRQYQWDAETLCNEYVYRQLMHEPIAEAQRG